MPERSLLLTVSFGVLLAMVGSSCVTSPRQSTAESPPQPAAVPHANELGGETARQSSSPQPLVAEAVEKPTPVVRLAPGLEVDLAGREVRVAAQAALDEGWLEQAVCLAGTREHESLLVVETSPRLVHAALLLLGLEPGAPGGWRLEPDGTTLIREAPRGAGLELLVRREGAADEPLTSWATTAEGERLPEQPWVFAGSVLDVGRDGEEIYRAEFSGSVAGLVTFGDEVIAFESVHSDQVDLEPAPFRVRAGTPPTPGTPVTLVIRPRR